MEKNISSILGTLIVSFIIGGTAMVLNMSKANEILETKLVYITEKMRSLEIDLDKVQDMLNEHKKSCRMRGPYGNANGSLEIKTQGKS